MTIRHVRPVVGYRVHATYDDDLEGETLCGRRPKAGPDTSHWLAAGDEPVDCPRCLELYPVAPAAAEVLPEPPRGLRKVARLARRYFRFLGA